MTPPHITESQADCHEGPEAAFERASLMPKLILAERLLRVDYAHLQSAALGP